MKTKVLLLLLAAGVAGLGFWIRGDLQKHRAEEEVVILAAQGREVREKLERLERERSARNAIPRPGESTRGNADAMAAQKSGARSDRSQPGGSSSKRQLSPESIITNDAARMAEFAKQYRASLDFTMGGLFRTLNLPPELIEKVKDVKVWHKQAAMDMRAAAEAEGLFTHSEDYAKLEGKLEKTRREKVAALLDPLGLTERFENYEKLRYLRETVAEIASIKMGTVAPATFEQVNRAVEILAATNQRPAQGNSTRFSWQVFAWSWADWPEIKWEIAGPQLKEILSPALYASLRERLAVEESNYRVVKRQSDNAKAAARLSRQPGG